MNSFETLADDLLSALSAMSAWEATAVVLAVAYLVLAVKENITCWYAAFASTAIFLFIFWDVNLLMESALQVFYLIMAVYGWYQWQTTGTGEDTGNLLISTWSARSHAIAISSIALVTFLSGHYLSAFSTAALPYLDSFTTCASVVTTYMVTKKILENWIYWLVIDSISIYLYIDRSLYLTALLFMIYIIIIFFGFNAWLKSYRHQETARCLNPAS